MLPFLCVEVTFLFACFVGVKALKNGLVISSSVDQRLVVWEIVGEDQVLKRKANASSCSSVNGRFTLENEQMTEDFFKSTIVSDGRVV